MSDPKSVELLARAERVIPGGVNSPVRAFRSVGGKPVFISRKVLSRRAGGHRLDAIMRQSRRRAFDAAWASAIMCTLAGVPSRCALRYSPSGRPSGLMSKEER